MKPRLLDLFCRADGAGAGYHAAGFDVVGVDVEPQPNYPFAFICANVVGLDARFLSFFDAIHASPPCQAHSRAQRLRGRFHPNLIGWTQKALRDTGKPYVIENVEGAPLHEPITLCGAMFPGLGVYRHRLFETNWGAAAPPHPAHVAPVTKMGRPPVSGEFMHVVGNFSGVARAREAMGAEWMTRDELREAIPPAYTEFLGRQLIAHLQRERLAA